MFTFNFVILKFDFKFDWFYDFLPFLSPNFSVQSHKCDFLSHLYGFLKSLIITIYHDNFLFLNQD